MGPLHLTDCKCLCSYALPKTRYPGRNDTGNAGAARDQKDIRRVTLAAVNYLEAANCFDKSNDGAGAQPLPLFDGLSSETVDEHTLHLLLKRLDAEVLRLYDLPARAEKKLLDLFAKRERPGVPGSFKGYYPRRFTQSIPLYAYLSDSYQAALHGASLGLPPEILDRFDKLVDKQLAGELSGQEGEELHRLQAEVDGRDYAARAPDTDWLGSIEEAQQEAMVTLGEIANNLIDLSRDGLPRNENPRPDDPAPGSTYPQYKPHLQPLFRYRCAHCQTHEKWRGGFEGMTVDHFLPRDRYQQLLHEWSNLYYSCTVCNCYYKKNHPTEAEEAAGDRFVDPCQDDPDDHFRLVRCPKTNQLCCIKALSDAGRFTLKILKLHVRPQLRDHPRQLELAERRERENLQSIETSIRDWNIVMEKNGTSPEATSVLSCLSEQRNASLERLDDIVSQRPFPAEL